VSAVRIFATTPNCHDGDNAFLVINVIDHAPVTNANPPTFQAAQLPASPWAWVIFQLQDGLGDATEIRLVDAIQFSARFAI